VKELQDTPGSEYFEFLSRKAHEGASNQARIDVAEARMRGEIGEAAKRGHTSKLNMLREDPIDLQWGEFPSSQTSILPRTD
jgi:hypothetical protein